MRIIVLFACLVLSAGVFGQTISGVVKEESGKAFNGATVSLLRAADSVSVKYAATKQDGRFQFNNIQPGNYIVSVSHVGYAPKMHGGISMEQADVAVPDIQLAKVNAELKSVTVLSRKPMIEVRADKTILNVEGTINAVGTDALELLRKSPGVLVDKDDNLSLSGKNGVQVYIDGRPTPLAGKDLADYLKTLQSANIEALEIITNPSAKYEAAGNAGIINIRLKKNKSYGTNGSVNAGWSVGTFPKYNGGLSLNNRNRRSNIFGTYNYNRFRNLNSMAFYRTIPDSIFDQKTAMQFRGNSHNYKVGADFFLGKKSTLGFIVNGSASDNMMTSASKTRISYMPTKTVARILEADNSNDMQRDNTNINLNYRYADTTGRELNLDADYGFYNINSDQLQPNIYYDANRQYEISRKIYNMLSPSNIDIYSFKADYEQNFKKGKLGVGGKVSYVNTDNDFRRFNVIGSAKELDTLRSNRFDYTENVNALYVNYNRPFKGFMMQFGLRAENTTSKGNSTGHSQDAYGAYHKYDSTFRKQYTDFFPSVALTINKNPMSQVGFTYSRRIDRPAYQDLNPFEFKLDDYTFMKGNTQLRPQYTNSFGVTHTYKYRLNTALNYSHVADVFAQLIDTAEVSKSFLTKKNLATQDIISLNVSYPYQHKQYSAFVNLNTYYSMYKANLEPGKKVDINVYSFNVYAQQSLKFAKTWTAEVSGWFSSPSVWQGTFKTKSMGGVDAGVQKTVFKGKGNLKASVSDVFNTMKWSGHSDYNPYTYTRGSGKWESQQFKLNFSYRFGNSQVKAARQRQSALEEEAKRTQSAGGIGQ